MASCQPGTAATGHEQCSHAACSAVRLPMQKTPVQSSHLLLHLVAECGGGHLHEAVDAGGYRCLVGQVPADAALVARLWKQEGEKHAQPDLNTGSLPAAQTATSRSMSTLLCRQQSSAHLTEGRCQHCHLHESGTHAHRQSMTHLGAPDEGGVEDEAVLGGVAARLERPEQRLLRPQDLHRGRLRGHRGRTSGSDLRQPWFQEWSAPGTCTVNDCGAQGAERWRQDIK